MRTLQVFAILLMSGLVMSQALKIDAKYRCLSNIINVEDEWTLVHAGQNEHFSYLDNVNHLLLYYKGLTSSQRTAVDGCGLNLVGAIGRCEKVHGTGNCEKITSTFVNRKCPENFRIEGCCQCVISCPKNWKDDGYWCMKPTALFLDKYDTMEACISAKKTCVSVGDKTFTEECPELHTRIGLNLCTARCPLGWNDQGYRCMKPATHHVGHPFAWTLGDN